MTTADLMRLAADNDTALIAELRAELAATRRALAGVTAQRDTAQTRVAHLEALLERRS